MQNLNISMKIRFFLTFDCLCIKSKVFGLLVVVSLTKQAKLVMLNLSNVDQLDRNQEVVQHYQQECNLIVSDKHHRRFYEFEDI